MCRLEHADYEPLYYVVLSVGTFSAWRGALALIQDVQHLLLTGLDTPEADDLSKYDALKLMEKDLQKASKELAVAKR